MTDEEYFKSKEHELMLTGADHLIIRLDGNSFSKFTKSMNKPFDSSFEKAMNDAAKAVLDYCDGAILAYVQSDEISIWISPKQPFLNNRCQKIASLCAATATLAFSKHFKRDAIFDCRVFALDEEDIWKYFAWRQKDCMVNAVSSAVFHQTAKAVQSKRKATRLLHGVNTRQKVTRLENVMSQHRFYGRVITKIKMRKRLKDVMSKKKLKMLIEKGYVSNPEDMVERSFWKRLKITPEFTKEFMCEISSDTKEEMLRNFYSQTLKPVNLNPTQMLERLSKEQSSDH